MAAGGGVQLVQDRPDVVVDGPYGHDEPGGDLGVGQTPGEQPYDLELALGEAGGVAAGRGDGTARDAPDAQPAQLGADQPGQRFGAQGVERGERLDLVGGM